ncbi:uncharacterized protein BXZ73DRAFT_42543 [Epithele typhae]|uniref:uncharacterized protein n=1 Tax=Epithele typhae TaxID=378194 RepID=UPI00200817C2|nr:uncharacterized protein BXZ73DRAFT_42543 [Epithele typhae]KAH9940818.1 hypothetical protein BXZ73DRAFT_42543 [Epithele typhae]
MSPLNPTTARIAPHPFNKASADLTIRCADGVDFLVRHSILLEASPIFEDMLAIPQPPLDAQDVAEPRPVVVVTESSRPMDVILRLCYPIRKPDLAARPVDELEDALKVALKYEMDYPRAALTTELVAQAETYPMQIWAVACRTGLEDLARAAGDMLIQSYRDKEKFSLYPLRHVHGISAGDYYRLRRFYRRAIPIKASQFKFLSSNHQTSTSASTISADTPHPFSVDPSFADLVCRSSDGREFLVHRGALAAASPILRDEILALLASNNSDGSATTSTNMPVLQLPESGRILHYILCSCYPATASFTLDPYDMPDVIAAATRYQMPWLSQYIKTAWKTALWKNPVEAYFRAVRTGWYEGAKIAARLSLSQDLDDVYTEQMEHVSAWRYHRLLNYHLATRLAFAQIERRIGFQFADMRYLAAALEDPSSSGEPCLYNDRLISETVLRRIPSYPTRPSSLVPSWTKLMCEWRDMVLNVSDRLRHIRPAYSYYRAR